MGMGGAGMASLAKLLSGMGFQVSGCDLSRGESVQELEALGMECLPGHSRDHVDRFDPQLLIYSSAVDEDCDELEAARARGVRTAGRGRALSWLFNAASGVGVAGTHGKTTTSSMLSLVLSRAGLAPTLYVGARMRDMGTNALLGEGRLFLAELDESDGSFELFRPAVSIVTNVDWDHVDHFPSFEDVILAFARFASGRKEGAPLIVCAEDEGAQRMLEGLRGPLLRYGWGRSWDWGAFDLVPRATGGISCSVCRKGKVLGPLELSVSGEHNVLNALAALAAADVLGVPFEKAAATLKDFHGAARRLQTKGTLGGVTVIDDYAHHPTEIAATLSALRGIYPDRRILLLYQPHRYTRTAALVEPLTAALSGADEILLLPIYSAGEPPQQVSAEAIVERLRRAGKRIAFCRDEDDALRAVRALSQDGDLLLTMGAGNVFRVGERFLDGGTKSFPEGRSEGVPDGTRGRACKDGEGRDGLRSGIRADS